MIIRYIKLENIRSYLNEQINFPTGSVLLSGDIGCGKTSILLAIEFALFGIRRKHLSGNSLLRKGKNNGNVELKFGIDGKEVIIKRTLKREKDKVEQDSGYIVIDGIKKQGTAVELKTQILNLLGYPKELITKTKNLVYRYTVYTPQEEMKQILIEDEDIRLDTLRKVFGIDKYKRIRENCQILLKEFRSKKTIWSVKIEDLENKKKERQELKEKITGCELKLKELMPSIEKLKSDIKKKKEKIQSIENKIREQQILKKQLAVLDIELKNKAEQRGYNKEREDALEKQISELKLELKGKGEDAGEIKQKLAEKEKEILIEEKKIRELHNRLNEFKIKREHSSEIKHKILHLNKCPVCEQTVSKEHKDNIMYRENKIIEEIDKNIEVYAKDNEGLEKKINFLKQEIEELRKQEKEISILKFKISNLNEKEKSMQELVLMREQIKQRIGEINIKKMDLNKKIVESKLEEDYYLLKIELDKLQVEEKRAEIEKTGIEKEEEMINKSLETIEKDIQEKQEIKKKLNYLLEMCNWVDNYFIKLMTVIEKHIMMSVYSEFNELFKEWFDILMSNETISVRLDDRFSPLVEQNGYEIEINNLSGGERTSAALAYRLALNRVINDLMSEIKTKDLIIFDEPTDGFSSEQLDRVREVLDQIGVKQTIIVSHESKIESFVDEVIKINKQEHVSEVIQGL